MTDYIDDFTSFVFSKGYKLKENVKETSGRWVAISVDGDKGRRKRGSYRLTIDTMGAVGQFIFWPEGVYHTYHSAIKKTWTPQDIYEWEKKKEEERLEHEKKQANKEARLHRRLTKLFEILPPAPDSHPYLRRKKIKAYDAKICRNKLVYKVVKNGKITSWQTIDAKGNKMFMRGGIVSGGYHPFIAPDSTRDIFLVAEGIADSASLYEATGYPVLCGFNANNIINPAKKAREKYKDATIVICADNDQFTVINGKHVNVGIEKGKEAAEAVSGYCTWPEFKDLTDKPKDFNDLHNIEGLNALKEQVQFVLDQKDCDKQEVDETQEEEVCPLPNSLASIDQESTDELDEDEVQQKALGDYGLPLKVLGFNNGKYFYLPFRARQIVALSPSAHTMSNLLQLASQHEWYEFYRTHISQSAVSEKTLVTMSTDMLMRLAESRGVFQEEDIVRGCGAWMDAKRRILHCGDTIYEDGVKKKPYEILSKYVYIAAARAFTPSNDELKDSEARALRQLCEMPTWSERLSGSLLAGWLVIAPICSMLPWRPHIWIRGEASSGKSTLLDYVIAPALGDIAIRLDGGTTEPAIRERLGYDGRPVIYDEADARNTSTRTTLDNVIMLARKASSGAVIAKYGQRPFKAQFCICFSSINTSISDYADESRITLMTLKKNFKPTAQEDYQRFMDKVAETIDKDFWKRLLSRTLRLMPVILDNISVFKKAVHKELNAARLADQLSPMIAGLFSLESNKRVTYEEAVEWVRQQNWSTATEAISEPDYIKCISHLSSSYQKISTSNGVRDVTIGELIWCATQYRNDNDYGTDLSDKALRAIGIAASKDGVTISTNNPHLKRIFRDTIWAAGWHGTLSDAPGSKTKSATYFAKGSPRTRAIEVPLGYFIEDEAEATAKEGTYDIPF